MFEALARGAACAAAAALGIAIAARLALVLVHRAGLATTGPLRNSRSFRSAAALSSLAVGAAAGLLITVGPTGITLGQRWEWLILLPLAPAAAVAVPAMAASTAGALMVGIVTALIAWRTAPASAGSALPLAVLAGAAAGWLWASHPRRSHEPRFGPGDSAPTDHGNGPPPHHGHEAPPGRVVEDQRRLDEEENPPQILLALFSLAAACAIAMATSVVFWSAGFGKLSAYSAMLAVAAPAAALGAGGLAVMGVVGRALRVTLLVIALTGLHYVGADFPRAAIALLAIAPFAARAVSAPAAAFSTATVGARSAAAAGWLSTSAALLIEIALAAAAAWTAWRFWDGLSGAL
ncbi:MAG: hypothetical protein IPM64_05045 [Phycisphaerales bacterium]|nr:hypothetical protein [Phycisphaerales bacterium]